MCARAIDSKETLTDWLDCGRLCNRAKAAEENSRPRPSAVSQCAALCTCVGTGQCKQSKQNAAAARALIGGIDGTNTSEGAFCVNTVLV